jgi:hypothetical protein
MSFASTVLACVLIAVCVGTALMDFKKPQQIIDTMTKLQVPMRMVPLLGLIKIVGAVGVVIGFSQDRIGMLAGAGLCVYFAVATTSHTRIKDSVRNTAPAFILLSISILYVLTTIAK